MCVVLLINIFSIIEFVEYEFNIGTQKYKGFFELLVILVTFWMIARVFSPDRSEKPFVVMLYFFLGKKSDFRSSFFVLEKNNKAKKLVTDSGKLLL